MSSAKTKKCYGTHGVVVTLLSYYMVVLVLLNYFLLISLLLMLRQDYQTYNKLVLFQSIWKPLTIDFMTRFKNNV